MVSTEDRLRTEVCFNLSQHIKHSSKGRGSYFPDSCPCLENQQGLKAEKSDAKDNETTLKRPRSSSH